MDFSWHYLKTNLTWVKSNAESTIALTLAVSMSILGIVDLVHNDLVVKTIPLTLGVVAFVLLRDRWRQEGVNANIQESIADVDTTLKLLYERIDQITPMEELMKSTQRTLDGLAAVRVVMGDDVSKALAEARSGTDRWIFKGGTGPIPAWSRSRNASTRFTETAGNYACGWRFSTLRTSIFVPATQACTETWRKGMTTTPGAGPARVLRWSRTRRSLRPAGTSRSCPICSTSRSAFRPRYLRFAGTSRPDT